VNEACFWSGFEKNPYPFCEEQLCSFVVEPANTWTNVAYLVVAIAIYRSRTVTDRRVKHLFLFSTLSLFVGSTLFHLSGTYLGKLLDVSAMFAVSGTILILSLERRFQIPERRAIVGLVLLFFASVAYLIATRLGGPLFLAQIALATYFEWQMRNTARGLITKRVLLSLGALAGAFSFWILDVTKVFCVPSNHVLTGHGIWHLLAGVAIWIFFSSYEGKKKGNGPL
jgi:hypothetical protein